VAVFPFVPLQAAFAAAADPGIVCLPEVLMLRRINAAVFVAPAGATIEVVAQSQNNNGVNDARFEYAGTLLDREQILGLPGCSFTVGATHQRLQAIVAFDDNAPGTARYDLSEVENRVLSNLGKFTMKSDGSPLIDFVIDPIEPAAAAGARRRSRKRAATKRPAKKAGRKPAGRKAAPRSRAKTRRRSTKTPASGRRGSRRRR
jgi:hypothetical protein